MISESRSWVAGRRLTNLMPATERPSQLIGDKYKCPSVGHFGQSNFFCMLFQFSAQKLLLFKENIIFKFFIDQLHGKHATLINCLREWLNVQLLGFLAMVQPRPCDMSSSQLASVRVSNIIYSNNIILSSKQCKTSIAYHVLHLIPFQETLR